MKLELLLVMTLASIGIFSLVFLIGILVYGNGNDSKILANEYTTGKDWLFNGFSQTLFNILYKNSKSEALLGINKNEYYRYCRLLHLKPEYEAMVSYRIFAVLFMIPIFLFLVLFSGNLVVLAICLLLIAVIVYALWITPFSNLKNKAEEKLFKVQDDLPRFLSLLEKALDLPVDQAILVTASRFESPMSEDLIDSINKISLGADGWQDTLYDLAKIYDIPDFSDLVMDMMNAYEQGINIRPLVNKKAYEVEQNRLYAVETHDAKTKTLIILPILVFKIVPLLALIAVPFLGSMDF